MEISKLIIDGWWIMVIAIGIVAILGLAVLLISLPFAFVGFVFMYSVNILGGDIVITYFTTTIFGLAFAILTWAVFGD